jgi:hypothetical protein
VNMYSYFFKRYIFQHIFLNIGCPSVTFAQPLRNQQQKQKQERLSTLQIQQQYRFQLFSQPLRQPLRKLLRLLLRQHLTALYQHLFASVF